MHSGIVQYELEGSKRLRQLSNFGPNSPAMNPKKAALVGFFALIAVAAISRIVPHWPNFTAVGATCLLVGAKFKRKSLALLVPMIAVLLSDLLLNNTVYSQYYEGFTILTTGVAWIIGGFMMTAIAGQLIIGRSSKPGSVRLVLAALVGSVVFFLLSNFGIWLGSPMFPQTAEGLATCYVAGLPFVLSSFAGNLVFLAVLLPAYEWYERRYLLGQASVA